MNMVKNKQMPFAESKEYVEHLVDSATKHAIKVCRNDRQRQRQQRTRMLRVTLGTAASLVLVLGFGWGAFHRHSLQQPDEVGAVESVQSPLDVFLDQISDEEAQRIECYEIDDISDY